MTEQLQRLTSTEVREEAPAQWRQILGRLKARFRTGDLATAIALVDRVGELAGPEHRVDISLNASDVVIALAGREERGITRRELDLAGQISEQASQLGLRADVSGLTQLELGLDTAAGEHLGAFYAALLAAEIDDGEPVDPSGQVPTVWWQGPGEPDDEGALPEPAVEQRWHVDVWVPHDEGERRLQAVLDAGGRLVSDAAAPSYWVVEDAEGNRSCICTPQGR